MIKIKRKTILSFILFFLLAFNIQAQSNKSKVETSKTQKYDKEFIDIPKGLLNEPVLLINRITGYPNKLFYYGSSGMNIDYSVILTFEIVDNQIKITQKQYQNEVADNDIIKTSVQKNHFDPLVSFIPIISTTDASVKISSNFFKTDVRLFSPIDEETIDKYKLKPLDVEHIIINDSKSDNQSLQVSRTLNYIDEKSPKGHYSNYLSIEQLLVFRVLPKDLMTKRKWEPRIGNFYLSSTKYDSESIFIKENKFIERWRLEPQDTVSYSNGILTRPKNPIVFYFDENVPHKWKKYIKQGVLDWLPVFEKIGFKDAIEVHDKPKGTKWDDNNPNYNMIRWVSSEIQDAQGNYISDPRTGEILNGTLTWYQNYFSAINSEYFVMTAAVSPSSRILVLSDSIFGNVMQKVMAHEMGHVLGLGHNMIASSSYPTDSLRSRNFLKTYSLSPSIMDYVSFNYIAQPEDMPLPLICDIGPYDYWAIEYAYKFVRPVNNNSTMEVPFTNTTLNKRLQDTRLSYMEQERPVTDPTNVTSDLGDDPILSGEYGLANLQRIMPHIVEWSVTENGDPTILLERYKEVVNQTTSIFRNVTVLIGGRKTRMTGSGFTIEAVDSETELKALDFLIHNAFNKMAWLYCEDLEKYSTENIYQNSITEIQTRIIKYLLNKDRLLRLIENDINNNSSVTTTLFRKLSDVLITESTNDNIPLNVQKAYIDNINELIQNSPNDLILNNLLKTELSKIHELISIKTQNQDNHLTKGFYIELMK